MIYTVLNVFLNFNFFTTKNIPNGSKYKQYSFANIIMYNMAAFVYSLNNFIFTPLYSVIIDSYVVLLQADRLPFKILPEVFKKILLCTVNLDVWVFLTKRIKESNNIFKLRQKKYYFINTYWTIFYFVHNMYYSELNIKKKADKKISNFYYHTRLKNKKKYVIILFYYINKIALVQYPYIYWPTAYLYIKYDAYKKAVVKSQHLRTHIFYMFINASRQFFKKPAKKSFVKLTMQTFKGVKNSFKALRRYKLQFVAIYNKPINSVRAPVVKIVNILRLWPNYIKPFTSKASLIIKLTKVKTIFRLKWYNKIHNTINTKKKSLVIMYLRSAKHFNKGRYSRNRQLYRTGVYWCIWLNVVIVYGLYYYFYRIIFSFGYLWLPLCIMILSIFGSRLYKYRYYSLIQIRIEIHEFSKLLYLLLGKIQYTIKYNLKKVSIVFIGFIKNYVYLLYKKINKFIS